MFILERSNVNEKRRRVNFTGHQSSIKFKFIYYHKGSLYHLWHIPYEGIRSYNFKVSEERGRMCDRGSREPFEETIKLGPLAKSWLLPTVLFLL